MDSIAKRSKQKLSNPNNRKHLKNSFSGSCQHKILHSVQVQFRNEDKDIPKQKRTTRAHCQQTCSKKMLKEVL